MMRSGFAHVNGAEERRTQLTSFTGEVYPNFIGTIDAGPAS